MSEAQRLISELQTSITETIAKLDDLTDAHLDHDCSHGCAMGDGVRGLLVHNIDHERMHLGQVHDTRFRQKTMQRDYVARLMAEWVRERAALAAALIGLNDEELDRRLEEGVWTIRETIEHTLYWERNSVDHLVKEQGLG
ncbi:MAG: DinB family protein [Chloroflexi bacterium]|nr:DinB family protein [Chloroflexota bacterium]